TRNILADWLAPHLSVRGQMTAARFMLVGLTAIALAAGLIYPKDLISLQLAGSSGIVQIFPAVVFSLFWKRMTVIPTVSGLIVGVALSMAGYVDPQTFAWLHGYPGVWGLLANVVVVWVMSLMTTAPVQKPLEPDIEVGV
ncbi:MAG: hypothetical protein OWS74_09045, partial [Firmicutes bacterium]|nr:hypothetical protein [Bacillota bacterium]